MALRTTLAIVAMLAVVAVPLPTIPSVPRLTPSPSLPALLTDAVPVPAGSSVSPLAPSASLHLAFTLSFSNAGGLASFLVAVSDPESTLYRHFLSYEEFEQRFGPSVVERTGVVEALRSYGASQVTVAPGGLAVDATMSAVTIDRLLGVSLVQFLDPAHASGYTVQGTPRLPPGLLGAVTGIDGLASGGAGPAMVPTLGQHSVPMPVRPSLGQFVRGNGTPPPEWFLGSDYTQAYQATRLFPGSGSVPGATFPGHVAIATLLASGFNATFGSALPPWSPTFVDAYFNDTFPPSWPLPKVTGVPVSVPASGVPLPPLPGPFHGENDSTSFVIENALDLEMAGSLAPNASLYNFYFSAAALVGATASEGAEYLADDLGAALSYSYGAEPLAVVSCSAGLDDLNDSQWDAELETAAAMGVTVVASSGDQGDAPSVLTGRPENPWPLWPATAAFNSSGAISVGGVTIALSGIPTSTFTSPPLVVRYDSNVQGIANVSAWWDTSGGPGTFAGSEGGLSPVYPEPWWQFHSAAQPAIVHAAEVEGAGQLGRAGPDVAFPANNTIAFVWAAPNGTSYFSVVSGTSVAAPVFAGLLADVVAVENATGRDISGLGFLDPEIYRIASYFQANPGAADPILDVVAGGNAVFSAGPGWDAVTGWGGLSAPLFLAADENATIADYAYAGPTPELPPRSSSVTSPVVVVIVLTLAAAATVGALLVMATRTRRQAPAPLPSVRYAWPPSPPPSVAPPLTDRFATFSCPYCGHDRPAEPVPCPSCGAR